MLLKSVDAFVLCWVKLSSPRDLLELLVFLAGTCAGSVSEEVCLAEGVLQGSDSSSLSEEHNQKLAGLGCFLGCSPET